VDTLTERPPPDPRSFNEQAAAAAYTVAAASAWWLATTAAKQRLAKLVEKELLVGLAKSEALETVVKNKAAWRLFWKRAVQKLGLRGTAAAALIMMDGPLPAGDLIALGLTVWMLYDLYVLAQVFWSAGGEVTEAMRGYGFDGSTLGAGTGTGGGGFTMGTATGSRAYSAAASEEFWSQMRARMPELVKSTTIGQAKSYVQKVLGERLARLVAKKLVRSKGAWRLFWRIASKKLAVRGTLAVTMAAIDGPLPIGDLLAIGLSLWTIYDLVSMWAQVWSEVDAAGVA
jgi:hypothetical protein